MHTYRKNIAWNTEVWPKDAGPGDTTTWHYQESTGLLLAKTDAGVEAFTMTTIKTVHWHNAHGPRVLLPDTGITIMAN